jgi:hypothetical protein
MCKEERRYILASINHVSSNMNAIQALALNTPMQDLILNHLLLSALDSETHKEWELQTATQQDIPSTSVVTDFLEARCKALELFQANQSASSTTTQQSPQGRDKVSQTMSKVSKPAYSYLSSQVQCPLCKGTHSLFNCNKFLELQPRQRFTQAKQLNLCFNCLEAYTQNHTCSTQGCQQCHKRHHTLLHRDVQNQPTTDKGSTTNSNLPANA